MTKLFSAILLFFIFSASLAFCDDDSDRDTSSYARLGVAAIPTENSYSVAPSFTAGKRAIIDVHGVDISTGFSGVYQDRGEFSKNDIENNLSFFYTIPKITYLRFFEPSSQNKLYGGLGGALGGSHLHHSKRNGDHFSHFTSKFFGLMGNALVGYNFESKVLSIFMQFDYSQPLIPIYRSHPVVDHPIYEVSFGLGF
jgi:hypothetical protein